MLYTTHPLQQAESFKDNFVVLVNFYLQWMKNIIVSIVIMINFG